MNLQDLIDSMPQGGQLFVGLFFEETMGTNKTLIKLMEKYDLSVQDVADLLRVQEITVKRWRVDPNKLGFNKMPEPMAELLKVKLQHGRRNFKS